MNDNDADVLKQAMHADRPWRAAIGLVGIALTRPSRQRLHLGSVATGTAAAAIAIAHYLL